MKRTGSFRSPPSLSLPSQPTSLATIHSPTVDLIFGDLVDFPDFLETPFDIENTFQDASDIFSCLNYQSSATVNLANPSAAVCATSPVSDSSQKQICPIDEAESKTIQIKYQPRARFRPRTEKESEDAAHYIRCEDGVTSKYPAIDVDRSWAKKRSLIQITLMGIDGVSHPYALENKERKTSGLVFKNVDEPNTLYFHLTNDDYNAGEKMFMMELLKSKQDHVITKALIKNRQLEQSMLRFTRFYEDGTGSYHADINTTAYSCVMTEDYGSVTIVDLFPLYGPMAGNTKVCLELKGRLPKDWKTKLVITISRDEIGWAAQVADIKQNSAHLSFCMPPFPYHEFQRMPANILIEYEGQLVHQGVYTYSRAIDNDMQTNTPLLSQPTVHHSDEHTGVKRPRQ